MLEKVKNYIIAWNMLSKGDGIVVGISGGADSVALLHVLNQLKESMGIELFGAHINHGLRGQAAKDDAHFSEKLCNEWNIPFFLKEVDIRALSRKLHKTEEETGRLVRYDFYNEVMKMVKANRIATAHHKNDQVETILHHIIRGTGMQGLTGIKPVSDGYLIRPLLDVSRDEIEDYLCKHNLPYCIDGTNEDNTYTRNRIRNELIPLLIRDYNPSIVDGLARMGRIIREEDDFIGQYCSDLYQELSVFHQDYVDIKLKGFNSCHPALQKRLVRAALNQIRGDLDGVDFSHIEAVVNLAVKSQTGSVTLVPGKRELGEPFNITVEKRYGVLRFRKSVRGKGSPLSDTSASNRNGAFNVVLPVPGNVYLKESGILLTAEKIDAKDGFAFTNECIYIDEKAVKGNLRIRYRQDGDRFRPFGLNGTKKLKDYFIDQKVPREQRDRIPLLVDEDNIVWVIGYQTSDDYKITPSTKDVLKISVQYTKTYGG